MKHLFGVALLCAHSMLGAQTLEWCHEAAYSQHVSELDAWTRTSLWESLPWAVRENPAR